MIDALSAALPAEMTAVAIPVPGGPEALVPTRRPVPVPIEGEVLARLSFSPADLHTFCSELTDRMRTGQERFH